MDRSIIEDIDELLKLGKGDSYRLKQIKEIFNSKNIVYISDRKYVSYLASQYLTPKKEIPKSDFYTPKKTQKTDTTKDVKKETPVQESFPAVFCWRCGAKNQGIARFCMQCATPIHKIDQLNPRFTPQPISPETINPEPVEISQKPIERKSLGSKKIISIGILAIILIAGAIVIGSGITSMGSVDLDVISLDSDSKCGAGTIFDEDTNECVITSESSEPESESDSKCGAGTVFDEDSNSCILASESSNSDSKCGPGTVFDEDSNSCVLG